MKKFLFSFLFSFSLLVAKSQPFFNQQPYNFGNSLAFDGVNDVVNFYDTLQFSNSLFNTSFWFQLNTTSQVYGNFFIAGFGPVNLPFFGYDNRFNQKKFFVNSNGLSYSPIYTLQPFEWYHVCYIIKELHKANVFLNGEFLFEFNISITHNKLNKFGGNTGVFIIDDVAIWNNLITPQQIKEIYNNGFGQDPRKVKPQGLTHYFNFNYPQGTDTIFNLGIQNNFKNAVLNNFNTNTCWQSHFPNN